MTRWQPAHKTRLLLRQLGFSEHAVRQAVSSYLANCDTPDDKVFLQRFSTTGAVSNESHQSLLHIAQLPLNWHCDSGTRLTLLREGFADEVIDHYRDLFVIRIREQGRVVQHTDVEFLRFCRSRSKQLAGPISDDWQPDLDTMHKLQRHHISRAFVLNRVSEFILYWRDSGRIASDWQQVFYKQVLTYSKDHVQSHAHH